MTDAFTLLVILFGVVLMACVLLALRTRHNEREIDRLRREVDDLRWRIERGRPGE